MENTKELCLFLHVCSFFQCKPQRKMVSFSGFGSQSVSFSGVVFWFRFLKENETTQENETTNTENETRTNFGNQK